MMDSRTIGDPRLVRFLLELGEKHGIAVQRNIGGGTDASPLQQARRGTLATTVGAPVRYMHSTVQLCHLDDIEVGENIGARLQADQAEADTRVARAKAEERRAIAIAREQEMKALTADNRSRVFAAEATVPLAMAQLVPVTFLCGVWTAAHPQPVVQFHWLSLLFLGLAATAG